MDQIISMKDVRLSLVAIARRAEAGERFIVVRDSKPVFRIEPCSSESSGMERKMTFTEFKAKMGSVREPDGDAWTPEAVEKEIRKMYHDRGAETKSKGRAGGARS